jgi:hypothetical protein
MYSSLFEAFKNNDADAFVELVDKQPTIENYVSCGCESGTGVVVNGEQVFYNGIELNNAIVDTIRYMMMNGVDFQPMVKFLERAIKSNSRRVVDELFTFIEACGLTITEDGCFLAYKSVREDYMDKYTGQIDNSVGMEHRVDKWLVDDDCNRVCSHGFHVGALAYAGPGGWYNNSNDKVMICKVSPEDVVSVPVDHSGQKLRTCAYSVVGEFKGKLSPTVYTGQNYDKPVERKEVDVKVAPEQMLVDSFYRILYCHGTGEVKWRFGLVVEKHSTYVIVELVDPEVFAGEDRRFNFDKMEEVWMWNDQDDDYDYDDEEEEEEEEEDVYDDNMNRYW